ncbi:MAG: ATP-binding protein [Deltaproteobacteria bacterium]|nr:ATP-binding protein [Myxococcales bacterium]MDP3220040.1 ATP-binding protein [Deltaproteobacteria bacterium]
METVPAPVLDARWASWLQEHNRRGARVAATLGLVIVPLFIFIDRAAAPPGALPVFVAGRAAQLVASALVLVACGSEWFKRWHLYATAALIATLGLAIVMMTPALDGLRSPYAAGLHLAMIGAGLLFLWPRRVVLGVHFGVVGAFVGVNAGDLGRLLTLRHPLEGLQVLLLASVAAVVSAGQLVAYGRAREQLDNRVKLEAAGETLARAHNDLQRLDAFKSRFFANVTHELKTPLALILSPLELLIDGEFGALTEPQRATLRSIYLSGARLLRLIGDLLDLSRLEESRLRLRVKPQDVALWLRTLVAQVTPLTDRKRVVLRFQSNVEAAEVWCDLDRLERVFVNLLSNAAKHTPEGGRITVSLDDDDERVRVSVEDTGEGFPPELAERLFERFFQVDSETAQNRYTQGGTGIGLALARELVELHGGTITARSAPGRGATFTVTLRKGRAHIPADVMERRLRAETVPNERRAPAGTTDWTAQFAARDEFRLLDVLDATERRVVERDADEGARGRTVLVVEDTPEVTRLIHTVLRQHFRVFTAPNGARGLDLAVKQVPDVVVTDLMMPEMDGLELTRRLRQDPRTRHVPVLMLTARGELGDRMEAMDSGVTQHMSKPFNTRELLAAVQKLAQASEAAAERVLTQQMDSLETIAGGLAHEINNPLNYVRNAFARVRLDVTEAFKLALPQAGGEAERARIATLEARTGRMFETAQSGLLRIGDTVALMRRYSREGFARVARAHDVFAGARDVAALVASSTGRPVELVLELDGEAWVDCVAEELHQAISNLVQNAIEAVADDVGRVVVRGELRDDAVLITVRDNGPGISAEDRARIFTPFFTRKAPGKGMGLGLTIVWRVTHALGGTVSVDSEPGQGAAFCLRLPRAARPAP